MYGNQLDGTVDLKRLPAPLETFNLMRNAISGTLDLSSLPSKLSLLNISENALSGELNLRDIPVGLKEIYLYQNSFEGTLHIDDAILESVKLIDLRDNKISELGGVQWPFSEKKYWQLLLTDNLLE